MTDNSYIYLIDDEDIIVQISHNWESFACCNGWEDGCGENAVVGKKIWDFIQGMETKHFYEEIIRKTRDGCHCGPIPFRCDAPGERRYLELSMTPLASGRIKITSRIVHAEDRDHVRLLDKCECRSNELVTLCSMCKKMKTAPEEWREIEEGVAQLRIFEAEVMPQVTHGVCPHCHNTVMAELSALKPLKKNRAARV